MTYITDNSFWKEQKKVIKLNRRKHIDVIKQKRVVCPICKGSGYISQIYGERKCWRCANTGKIWVDK